MVIVIFYVNFGTCLVFIFKFLVNDTLLKIVALLHRFLNYYFYVYFEPQCLPVLIKVHKNKFNKENLKTLFYEKFN